MKGSCYLIHFSKPYKHACHYIGWTDIGVLARLERHKKGLGANLTKHAVNSGIELTLAKVWGNVDRHFERKLKRRGSAKRICPICRGEN